MNRDLLSLVGVRLVGAFVLSSAYAAFRGPFDVGEGMYDRRCYKLAWRDRWVREGFVRKQPLTE